MTRVLRAKYRLVGCHSVDIQDEVRLTGKETQAELEVLTIDLVRQDEEHGDEDDKIEFTEYTITLIP